MKAVIDTIDQTLDQVQGDNGYADVHLKERAFVVDGLSAFSKRLKDASSISVQYIRRYGIEPLSLLTRRFSKAAHEVTVAAAREALKAWLVKHGLGWLDHLL